MTNVVADPPFLNLMLITLQEENLFIYLIFLNIFLFCSFVYFISNDKEDTEIEACFN